MKILLAEDSEINRVMLGHMLSLVKCEVVVAVNGREAVDCWQDGGFDLVLMDCQMPEMSGLEAAQAIRSSEKSGGGMRTPIIALTANASADDRQRARHAGMDDLLPKPFRLEELRQLVDRWR